MKKLNNNKKVSNLENSLFIRLEEYTRKGWKGNGLLNIYDDMINVKYTVKGNFLSLKHCLHIYNIKGKEISTVQKKVSFFNDIYILKIENKKVGILKKKFNILRPTMILNNGWKVEGKIFGSGLSIKSNDKIIAKITSSKIDDSTYQIELDKNENELLILMIIVVTYIDNAIDESFVKKFDKLLVGGIWSIIKIKYDFEENKRMPFVIESLNPIQLPNMDIEGLFEGRKHFTKDEWMDILIRSMGIEPSQLKQNQKWHFLERIVPLVENNYNMCELGPRGTGKSHIYKEISPNSILVSGGQTTVANLFYNMGAKKIGLVGMWDCVAFDEVAGIHFKDKDGIQIMKDYMASGSFARGKEEKNANASMVFVGNINQSVEVLLKTSHLFEPFPPEMANDSAFFDRMHYYLPGWEIPKMRPELITDEYGFITDYISEFFREMRKRTFSDSIDKYFRLGNNLNQRDVIAVRKTISGLVKVLYPDGEFTKEELEEILEYALVGRRRVKEQLKKIGGMEFYDVHFSYIDNETMEEKFVSVPEIGGGKLIPEGMLKAGQTYYVGLGNSGRIGTYKIEVESPVGHGKFETTGVGSDRETREALSTSFNYFKANKKSISSNINTETIDYLLHIQDLQGTGPSKDISLASYVAMCSSSLKKPMQGSLVILGSMSIGGTISKVDELANTLQVCFDSGAKKILLPMSSASDISQVPSELFSKFNIAFYNTPEDAVYKALGIE